MKPITYIIGILLLMGCEKEPTPIQIAVSTEDATNITTNSASILVSMDKNNIIDETGVLYSTDSLFKSSSINKSYTQEITSTKFNFLLSNLSAGTKYFYKAYASGKSNSVYGVTKSFVTEQIQFNINIPDPNFKAYLVTNFDTNKDGEISEDEASVVTSIWCDTMNIESLQGIEHFTSIKKLYCPGNKLTVLDLSNNTKLHSLVCDFNQIKSLKLGSNSNLHEIWCARNELVSIDISGCPNLDFIYCYSNKLTSLNTHSNIHITNISCWSNQIQSLDLSNNKELTILQCGWNKIAYLNLQQNKKLKTLSCVYNNLSILDISNNTEITSLQCFGMDNLQLYIKSGQIFETYSIGNSIVHNK